MLRVTLHEDTDFPAQREEILSIADRVEDEHQMDHGKNRYLYLLSEDACSIQRTHVVSKDHLFLNKFELN